MQNIDIKNQKNTDFLIGRVNDLFTYSKKKGYPFFSKFYNEQEISEIDKAIKFKNEYEHDYLYFGGYNNSTRKILGVFPDRFDPDSVRFPITPIKFNYLKHFNLTHRDVLGSIMSINIERNMVGDICISEGQAVIFLISDVAEYVLANIIKIRNVGVKGKRADEYYNNFCLENKFLDINGTISSLRLDCFVSFISKISRAKACTLIKQNQVFLNHSLCKDVSKIINVNNIITIRGYGKYIFEGVVKKTKKDRLFVNLKKYM